MAILTATQLRTLVPAIADSAKFPDTELEDLVAEFTEIAEQYRGAAYEPRTVAETILPTRTVSALSLAHPHVQSIVSVSVDGTALEDTEYELDALAGALVATFAADTPVVVVYTYCVGTRTVTDGVTTDTDATVTSATAAFTAADVGEAISGDGIADGTTIASVTSATSIELSAVATATATGVDLTIGGPPKALLRACRQYVRACALSDKSSVPRDVITQADGSGGYTRFSTPDKDAGRPTGYLEVDRLLNSLDDYRPSFA